MKSKNGFWDKFKKRRKSPISRETGNGEAQNVGQEHTFQYLTRGNADPRGKTRVYFTCHPADFDKHFHKVCEDILKHQDCAIYYTDDMTADLSDDNSRVDLERMNLFVIPVTFQMLRESNRAMDWDFRFAMENHIPVLPFMMESGIDDLYSLPDKFGQLRYINPFSTDLSEIKYEDKLKKYLESVLISDETAKRIRAAFDAYVFLSYRKKDRAYANQLMKMIHNIPEFRDVAIWYDEFLTPGESFQENIEKMLSDSKLYTMLVTPHLLERPNYVMNVEYPAAVKSGKEILPAEMIPTDHAELEKLYEGIPDCIETADTPVFDSLFVEHLKRVAVLRNDHEPEHNFLIGLAYLNGIDVEVDINRAVELIADAGEAGLPEAMEQLWKMYLDAIGVERDYRKALYWIEKKADHYVHTLGEEHPDTLGALNGLAWTYDALGNHHKARELYEKGYAIRCKVFGEEHPNTMISLNNLASAYGALGDYSKAKELNEKGYNLSYKVLGEEHPDTLNSLSNLAYTYNALGDYGKALELNEKGYAIRCKVLGEEHPDTLQSLNNLANTYNDIGNHKKALELLEKGYTLCYKVLGEEHPDTLTTLNNLATTYNDIGNHKKALELLEKGYAIRCKVLGEEHPDTLTSLNNLASLYGALGAHIKAKELKAKVYNLRCKVLGEEHPSTLVSLSNLAYTYNALGDYGKALELNEKGYAIRCKVLGEEHPDSLNSLNNLATTYSIIGNHEKALELLEKGYALCFKVFGKEHPNTLTSLHNLAYTYGKTGNHSKEQELLEKLYTIQCIVLGEEHPYSIETLHGVLVSSCLSGNRQNALEACRRLSATKCQLNETIINNIAYVYEATGFPDKAEAIRQRKSKE